jgi:hypothetical protein
MAWLYGLIALMILNNSLGLAHGWGRHEGGWGFHPHLLAFDPFYAPPIYAGPPIVYETPITVYPNQTEVIIEKPNTTTTVTTTRYISQ